MKRNIWTRLCTLTLPSPEVSIAQKMLCGYLLVMRLCTPSLTPDDGMHPNGFTDSVMCALLWSTLRMNLPTSMCPSPPRTLLS